MSDKRAYLKLYIVITLVVTSFLFVSFGHEIWGGVVGLLILVICSWFFSRLDLAHPLTWFPPAFFLYATSLPILVGMDLYVDRGAISETLFIEWVALLTFIVSSSSYKPKIQTREMSLQLSNSKYIVYPMYVISILLSSVYLIYIFITGINKYEISLSTSPIMVLGSFFSVYVLSFLLLFGKEMASTNKVPKKLLIFNVLFGLIILLISGERDVILKVLIGALFFYHFFQKKISKQKLFLFGASIVSLLPIMQNLKSGLVKEGVQVQNSQPFIYGLLGGEFISASRNLNTLLVNRDKWDFFLGETFIWDLEIAFFNGNQSTLGWFHNVFYPNLIQRGGGNGFTIVGEGYINFGILGVILVFAFIALILKFLYHRATRNVLWLVIYIAAVPIFVYLNRADFANLYAQVGKHIILPIMILYLLKKILEGATNKKAMFGLDIKRSVKR